MTTAEKINKLTEKFKVHLVTCGDCGAILNSYGIQYKEQDKIVYLCPVCDYEEDPSCFPDLFYGEPVRCNRCDTEDVEKDGLCKDCCNDLDILTE